jgi:hypothetical protein
MVEAIEKMHSRGTATADDRGSQFIVAHKKVLNVDDRDENPFALLKSRRLHRSKGPSGLKKWEGGSELFQSRGEGIDWEELTGKEEEL